MYFKVYNVDPDKAAPLDLRSRLSRDELLARIETVGRSFPLARVETDDFTVEGPRIGLNQLTDEAWVDGRGVLTQLAPRGLLTDKGMDNNANTNKNTSTARPTQRVALAPAPGPASATSPVPAGTQSNMTPLRITWTHSMQFKGQSTNPKGLPAGRAHFVANVRAEMEDSLMLAQEMTTYLDRTIKLNRPRRDGAARPANGGQNGSSTSPEAAETEPKPQIALIDCKYKVLVDNRKVDPETKVVLQRQVIDGEQVVYDKLTGNFLALPAPGRMGRVYLYNRDGQETIATPGPGRVPAPATPAGPSTTADGRTIRPTANPTSGPGGNLIRATEVVGRNATTDAATGINARGANIEDKLPVGETQPARPKLMPLKVTQIMYADEMHGRFGTGKEQDTTDPRWADFFGDVEVLHALVPDDKTVFDFDNPPPDATFLTAQTIRVVSEPPPPGSTAPARSFLKAWENAEAETIDTTIQADKITYDSAKELFYAYGELDQVYFVQQKFFGQPASTATGRTLKYNRRTGESEVDNPNVVQFVDDKFGVRPGWATPKPEIKKPKKPLAPFRGPGRAHFERKGFNGH
jgi:lipopolysaccharide export system protein LptA